MCLLVKKCLKLVCFSYLPIFILFRVEINAGSFCVHVYILHFSMFFLYAVDISVMLYFRQ